MENEKLIMSCFDPFSDILVDLGQIEQEFGYKYIELQLVSSSSPQ